MLCKTSGSATIVKKVYFDGKVSLKRGSYWRDFLNTILAVVSAILSELRLLVWCQEGLGTCHCKSLISYKWLLGDFHGMTIIQLVGLRDFNRSYKKFLDEEGFVWPSTSYIEQAVVLATMSGHGLYIRYQGWERPFEVLHGEFDSMADVLLILDGVLTDS